MSLVSGDATILKDSVWNVDPKHVDIYVKVNEGKKYYIRNISWVETQFIQLIIYLVCLE